MGCRWLPARRSPNYESEIVKLTTGCAVEVEGTVVASQGKDQEREIQATRVTLIGAVDDPETYPIAKKRHTFEYLRTVAHLRPRTNTFGAIARLRNSIAQAVHGYFHRNGFVWVNTPIITASDCEGAGQLFRVSTLDALNPPRAGNGVDFEQDFFGQQTYLTVSGQLNVESYCLALSKVYTFGPTFRAENSNTSRHLAEFWMIEPEVAFADLSANADLAEDFLKTVFKQVLEERPDDMAFFADRIDKQAIARLEHLIKTPFVRMDYTRSGRHPEKVRRTVRVSGRLGTRSAIGTRTLSDGEARRRSGCRRELSEGDQGVLHAAERRRPHRRRDGRTGARRRRNHRRQSARRASGDARCADGGARSRRRAVVVSRSAPIRLGAARRVSASASNGWCCT